MIPYDIDPTLYDAEPRETLDDGFSAPNHHDEAAVKLAEVCDLEAALAAKSAF